MSGRLKPGSAGILAGKLPSNSNAAGKDAGAPRLQTRLQIENLRYLSGALNSTAWPLVEKTAKWLGSSAWVTPIGCVPGQMNFLTL